MYTLRLTRSLLRKFEAESGSRLDVQPTTALGDWYVRGLTVGARTLAVCTSDRSGLTVVFPRPPLPDLPQHLAASLVPVLRDLDVPQPAIAAELDAMVDGEMAAARDRRALGVLSARATLVGHLVNAVPPGAVDARVLHRALADVRMRPAGETSGALAFRLLQNRPPDTSR